MNLLDQISADTKQALLNREGLKLSVLRMLLSELNYKKIDVQRELTDEDVTQVIRKEVKKRNEAIDSFTKAGREEQAKQETLEKQILEKYLPVLMGEEDIRKQIADGRFLEGVADFGQAMRIVSPIFKGKAQGELVAAVVKEWMTSK